jgi:hypothetical protein
LAEAHKILELEHNLQEEGSQSAEDHSYPVPESVQVEEANCSMWGRIQVEGDTSCPVQKRFLRWGYKDEVDTQTPGHKD